MSAPAGPSLEQRLLHSIPRKVYLWLGSLGVDLTVPGRRGALSWHFEAADRRAQLTVLPTGAAAPLVISWDMNLENPTGAQLTGPVPAAGVDLDWLVSLEKLIYAELEQLAEQVREKRSPS